MVIGLKDTAKLFGISVVSCCAVFVCALFLNYYADLTAVKDGLASQEALSMYEAQVATAKVVSSLSGGCLALVSAVMLLFYVKNYVDSHGKELGILKAIGYGNAQIALHFWVFGLAVFVGCFVGYLGATCYMPRFYEAQDRYGLFPELRRRFHPALALGMVVLPTAVYAAVAAAFAFVALKRPVLSLLKERGRENGKAGKGERENASFLRALRSCTLRGKKTVVFLVVFSAFCFSAMTQMSMSMKKYASKEMGYIMLAVGLVLAFVTLLLALECVVKANAKTAAMMRVFGYAQREIRKHVLNGYAPFACFGFLLGTLYQYGLLKLMVDVVFSDLGAEALTFNVGAFFLSLASFAVSYEAAVLLFSLKLNGVPLKLVMEE